MNQTAQFVTHDLAYHDYEGVALRDEEKPRLVRDLGDKTFLMLRNHGLLTVGQSVAEAWLSMYTFENTCRIQIDAQAGGELVSVNPAIMQTMPQVLKAVTAGQGANIAWPALLRKLDRQDPSYRT